jgi:threonine 3-dehydrogenase
LKTKREEGIWMGEAPMPEVGPNDVLIRVHKSAICGTDVHIYNWDEWAQKTIPVPMVVGHEYFGVIEAVGAEVEGYQPGDRVSGEGHITCGHCRNCRAGKRHLCRNTFGVGVNRTGSFAEYLSLPAFNVFKVPDNVPDDVAAIFDPYGNAAHTALSFDLVGEDVLITGAGPIGIMAAAVARHVGARHVVITDVNQARLDLASAVADVVPVNVARESLKDVEARLKMAQGFDVGMEMSGNQAALDQMVEAMVMGGRIAMLGIPPGKSPVDWSRIVFKAITIKGVYGREIFETWYKMIAMLQNGLDIRKVITHRFTVDAFQDGFAAMKSGLSGKVVLDWR